MCQSQLRLGMASREIILDGASRGWLATNSFDAPASRSIVAALRLTASTEQILELRDQDMTWTEVAEQVDMTVSGAWSRYRKARSPKPTRLGR
jgi:hypothetical protein